MKYIKGHSKRFTLTEKGKSLQHQLEVVRWKRNELAIKEDMLYGKIEDHKRKLDELQSIKALFKDQET